MGIRGILSIRQFRCGVIFSALFAVLSYPASAHPDKWGEQVRLPPLVETGWLQEQLDTPGVVIVDTRIPEEYAQGHITGAINIPSAETFHAKLKHRVASQFRVQQMLASRGIQRDDYVIVYDCGVYLNAARIHWTLSLYGHPHVAIMNGGYPAWRDAGLPTDTHFPVRVPSRYRTAIRPGLLTTRLQMLLAIDNPAIAIVDARGALEYQGVESQASRSGHIPKAMNIPADVNLEVRQGLRFFKPRPALEELYKELDNYNKIILYCNNGCESSTSYLALRLVGKQVSIYDGGWMEWGNNPGLPIVTPGR